MTSLERRPKVSERLLTKAECNALRGVAILAIVLHNYCHWLSPIIKENEYTFDENNVRGLTQVLSNPDLNLPLHLISFFGHYGVPLFLFLSAFGLVRKYEQSVAARVPAAPFIRYHWLKLFKMMIVGFVSFVLVDAVTPSPWHYDVVKVLAQLALLNNLLPDPDHQIWPGPYWFFGLMFQLYIVYRLLLYRRHWSMTVGLMAVCVIAQLCLLPDGEALNRYRYNFMGGMLPFGLGLLYARYADRLTTLDRMKGVHWLLLTLFFTLLTVVMSFDFLGWTLVPVMVCGGGISLVKWIERWPKTAEGVVMEVLEWLGSVSAALFVCHPITRKILIPISRRGDIYTGLLLYIVASVCLAWLFKQLLRRIPSPKLNVDGKA